MVMGNHKLKPALIALLLLFISAFNVAQAQSAPAPPDPGFPCNLVECGHGTCHPTFPLPPFFECVCDSGWKQISVGPLNFPPCLLPNCTLDFSCGGAEPPPPPPPPASLFSPLPTINFSDPCNYTSCGAAGNCVTEGSSSYRCDCKDGYANLLNDTALLCVPLCSIAMDCNIELGQPPPPAPDTRNKNDAGGRQDRSFAENRHGLTVLTLLAILCPWL